MVAGITSSGLCTAFGPRFRRCPDIVGAGALNRAKLMSGTVLHRKIAQTGQ
jgi:hypothetical protein